jgi:signal transduction histidine kinase
MSVPPTAIAGFGNQIGARIQAAHQALSRRWLDRLKDLLPVGAGDVFPSDSLLDHIPALLHQIGAYVRAPEQEEIAANSLVIEKARELGLLRHAQRASVHQLLREYDLLARILETFIIEEVAGLAPSPSQEDCMVALARVNRAVRMLMQTTVDTFVSEYMATIAAQTERLADFNRMVSHELRNPLSTLQYAIEMMKAGGSPGEQLGNRLTVVAERNVSRMIELIRKLEERALAGRGDSAVVQKVDVASVAREAARQLREMAEARAVEVRVDPNLPELTVDVARLELVLLNLLANGIKYADPAKMDRFVEIALGPVMGGARQVDIAVRDNGIGIPPDAGDTVFDRFSRVHGERDQELANDGAGLGLAIVRECVKALGGSITFQSTQGAGTTFLITLPRTVESSGPA